MRKMKLLLPLVMLFALALSAAAEPAPALEPGYIAFEHPRFGYSIEYPAGWTLLDKDGIDAVFDAIAAGETELSQAGIQMMEQARQEIELNDIALVISPTLNGHSVNVLASPMDPLPTVQQAQEQLAPLLKQQYEQMFTGLKMLDEGSVIQVGGLEAMKVAYAFTGAGQEYTQNQYYFFTNGHQYIFTFTWVSPTGEELALLEAHGQHMLESFAPAP